MTDRVFPAAKPTSNGGTAAPAFPATKAQLYGATTRSTYRPQPSRRRHRRGCCCRCCFWTTAVLLLLILLIAAATAIFYVLYRPHRPSFSVSSFHLAYLNTTSSGAVNSKFNLTVTARNPNKKIVYIYSPISIAVLAGDVDVGDGSIPAFVHGKRNTTVLRSSITSKSQPLDSESQSKLKTALKANNGVALKVKLDTKVKLKAGGLKTPRIGIRVTCDGIRATIPAAGKAPAAASTANVKCKVHTRIKIWKWTF